MSEMAQARSTSFITLHENQREVDRFLCRSACKTSPLEHAIKAIRLDHTFAKSWEEAFSRVPLTWRPDCGSLRFQVIFVWCSTSTRTPLGQGFTPGFSSTLAPPYANTYVGSRQNVSSQQRSRIRKPIWACFDINMSYIVVEVVTILLPLCLTEILDLGNFSRWQRTCRNCRLCHTPLALQWAKMTDHTI